MNRDVMRMAELAEQMNQATPITMDVSNEFFAIDQRMRSSLKPKRTTGAQMRSQSPKPIAEMSDAEVAKTIHERFLAQAREAHAGMLAAGLKPKSTVEEFAAILKAEALSKIESGEASGELGELCAVKEIDWPVHQ